MDGYLKLPRLEEYMSNKKMEKIYLAVQDIRTIAARARRTVPVQRIVPNVRQKLPCRTEWELPVCLRYARGE